jgi:hypothetical protein
VFILLCLCLLIIMAFSVAETVLHKNFLKAWIGFTYFSLLGIGVSAFSFGLINFVFSWMAHDLESKRWHGFFGFLGFSLFVLLTVFSSAITYRIFNRLQIVNVVKGVGVLILLFCILFAVCSAFPSLNWL